ncbi:DUF4173 domain-containing protein [Candidatus Uhrbacteria bacterium]|jgi:hypothetical protein|nr:DUF4173 domain-containing protein [Candidatus Uhrbacteria bacterium]
MNMMDTSPLTVSKLIKPSVLALTSLALGIVWDIFFFGHQWGVVVPLFAAMVFGVIVVFDRFTHRHLSWYEAAISGTILIMSLFFAIRDGEFLLGLNAFAMTYLFIMLMVSLYGAPIKKFKIWDFVLFPLIDGIASVFERVPILRQLKRRSGVSSRVARGSILALIVATIFIALFAAADEVARELLTRLLHVEDIMELLDDLLMIAVISFGFLFMFAPAFWKRAKIREIGEAKPKKELGIETAIVLGTTNLVFVGFLLIQAVYLFGGKASLESLGLTYATYAREGFAQLIVVALIVIAITWAVRMIRSDKHEALNKVLNGSLLVLTLGVLWSSWTRLGLYEEAFGFTHDRLFAHYGLVVVAIILVILFAALIAKLKDNTILHSIVFTFAIALIGLNFLNPDAFIARHNIDRGDTGSGIDYHFLFRLSDDAASVIVDHVNSDEFQDHISANHQRVDEYLLVVDELEAHQLVRPDNSDPEVYNTDVYKVWQATNRQLQTRSSTASRSLDAQSQFYSNWIKNYEYNDEWQAWNLSRWQAKIIHDQF